jgi:hypothetical protein
VNEDCCAALYSKLLFSGRFDGAGRRAWKDCGQAGDFIVETVVMATPSNPHQAGIIPLSAPSSG